jgi:hypothetical protein
LRQHALSAVSARGLTFTEEQIMDDRKKLLNEVFEAALQYDMTYFG